MSLVDEVGYFLARTRMDEREFGRRAVDDAQQVENMRRGVPVTAGRALRLRQFIAANMPADEVEIDASALPLRPRPMWQARSARSDWPAMPPQRRRNRAASCSTSRS